MCAAWQYVLEGVLLALCMCPAALLPAPTQASLQRQLPRCEPGGTATPGVQTANSRCTSRAAIGFGEGAPVLPALGTAVVCWDYVCLTVRGMPSPPGHGSVQVHSFTVAASTRAFCLGSGKASPPPAAATLIPSAQRCSSVVDCVVGTCIPSPLQRWVCTC